VDVVFFESAAELRQWFEQNHDQAGEAWIGFYNKRSGKTGVTYPEAVDEALCFGWIDGIRKKHNEDSYVNRFTPRRKGSNWSAVNIKRVEELTQAGRMHPAGLAAFEARDQAKKQGYSYEERPHQFDDAYEQQFRQNPKAWEFFQSQTPSYQRVAIWYVISAKKEETRQKRLATLIEVSENGKRLLQFNRTGAGE
jgi:uncharacterized protein YdeI (YjbR/CyaY-like superfamily)